MRHPQQIRSIIIPFLSALALAGCAPSRRALLNDVNKVVADRAGAEVQWRGVTAAPDELDRCVRELASTPLTAQSAIRIALLNNRDFQARLEELGFARADLVEAATASNPVFDGSMIFPREGGGRSVEMEILQSVTDLLMIPARRRHAGFELESVRAEITHEALKLAGEARAEFHAAQAADRITELMKLIAQTEEASADLALRMREAGNIGELDAARRLAAFEQARVDLARSQLDAIEQRERLTRILGLWGDTAAFTLDPQLPEIPEAAEPGLDQIECLALEGRMDLAAARAHVDAARAALSAHRFWRWFPSIELGGKAEREVEGHWLAGPAWSIEAPIFDRGQGRLGRLHAELRRAEAEYEALAIRVRSEARLARERLLVSREIADHYRARLIPLRERISELMRQHYNYMLESPFEALVERQEQARTYREYIETVRDYWTTRGDLDLTIGAISPMAEEQASQPESATGATLEKETELQGEQGPEDPHSGHGGH